MYKVVSIVFLIIIFFLIKSCFQYKGLYDECINGRTIDTIYIDTTKHYQETISPVALNESKRNLDTIINKIFSNTILINLNQDSLRKIITDSILNLLNVDRVYENNYGDSLVSIKTTDYVNGILTKQSAVWQLHIPPIINRIDSVESKSKFKNRFYLGTGIGYGENLSLNANILFVHKKNKAYSLSYNFLNKDKSFNIYFKL